MDAGFRRLVLALGQGEAGPATLRGAAALARLLRLGLHCVLIEDAALAALPALPFVRELRMPTRQWRALEPALLADDLAAAEAALRRELARLGIEAALEVQRGDPVVCMGEVCVAGDIVVLAAAGQPRLHPQEMLQQVALRSAASVLLLPAGPMAAGGTAAGGGAVAALAAMPDDAALDAAARIAAAADMNLLVLLAAGDPAAAMAHAVRRGVPAQRVTVRLATGDAALEAALGAERPVLLVLDHAAWDASDMAEALARRRAVPVLLLETRAGVSRPA